MTPLDHGSPEGRSLKRQVGAFWESEACGERYGADQDRQRYLLEPEIEAFADFPSAAGQRLLEIGVGMGADFTRWIRAGAQATGVDLTERAIALTRERIAREGLSADIGVADAEDLPFRDNQFDIVYSWGVLHHTPDTERALQEAYRVVAPGGRLKVMMYHRRSWVALAAWFRFGLLRGRPTMSVRAAVTHIESPGTKAITVPEVRALFGSMDNVMIRPQLSHWDRRLAPGISRLLGDRFGWFLLIEAGKPSP